MNQSARFSAHFARRPRVGAQVCPASSDLADAAAGNGTNERRRQIIDHLTDCPDCGELWQLAAAIHHTSGGFLGGPSGGTSETENSGPNLGLAEPASDRGGHRIHPHPWATAAALTLALGLTLIGGANWQRQTDQAPVYRNVTAPAAVLRARVPPVLPRSDFRLQWQAPAGIAVNVQLFDDSLNLIFTGYQLSGRSVLIPPGSFTGLASGSMLFWQLESTEAGSSDSIEGSVQLR